MADIFSFLDELQLRRLNIKGIDNACGMIYLDYADYRPSKLILVSSTNYRLTNVSLFNHWKEKTNWRAIFYSFIMFVEWVIFLAFVFMVIRLATSKLEYNWETTSCRNNVARWNLRIEYYRFITVNNCTEIKTDKCWTYRFWIQGRIDFSNAYWRRKLSVSIIVRVSLVPGPGSIRSFSLAFLLFWIRFDLTCSQTLFASSDF